MSKIMIVGVGRVGVALAKILHHIGGHELFLVDASQDAINQVLPQIDGGEGHVASGWDEFDLLIKTVQPAVIVCSTPFTVNIHVSQLAALHGCHYVDFTEDNAITKQVRSWAPTDIYTFVPQTGLAPGLITYLGLELFKGLGDPKSLSLRVGALSRVSTGPEHYSITWSPDGLINEYLQPSLRKRNHILEQVPSMDDAETVIIDGVTYEAFTTSGGVGSIEAYEAIPTVEYKTLRHPGHLEYMHKLLSRVNYQLDEGVKLAKETFTRTRDDVVVLTAWAVDQAGMSASTGIRFYPHAQLGITALELTTAGTGVAVVELILAGLLPAGPLTQNQIPMELIRQTKAYELIFSSAR